MAAASQQHQLGGTWHTLGDPARERFRTILIQITVDRENRTLHPLQVRIEVVFVT